MNALLTMEVVKMCVPILMEVIYVHVKQLGTHWIVIKLIAQVNCA